MEKGTLVKKKDTDIIGVIVIPERQYTYGRDQLGNLLTAYTTALIQLEDGSMIECLGDDLELLDIKSERKKRKKKNKEVKENE